MGLGGYPSVTLAGARERARELRLMVDQGIDPVADRKTKKNALAAEVAKAITFRQAAEQFLRGKSPEWRNPKHAAQWAATLEQYAFPVAGDLRVRDVELPHVLAILEPIWTTKTETASRLRGRIDNVMDWATAHGYREGPSPARWKGHLDKILAMPTKVAPVEHFAALPYASAPEFMEKLAEAEGMGARALEFAILTAARSGEVRGARFDEFDLKAGVWSIPAVRMKAGKEHRVALSKRAVGLVKDLMTHGNPDCDLVFPNTKCRPLSDATLAKALKKFGLEVTVHGFRSTFRDWAGETTAYPREVIEHALAHQLKDKAEAAYQRGDLFVKRRALMEAWANYLGRVKTEAEVISLRGKTV